MSEPSKGVPLAAVVYVVRFDAKGRPVTEAAIHIETSGATHLDGSAATSLEALLAATRCSLRLTVGQSMQELFDEKREGVLTAWDAPAATEPLAGAGEIF